MKIAVLMRPGRIDIGQLAARHPEQLFVPVEDAAGLARELPDAEVLVTANTHYDAAAAAIAKRAGGLQMDPVHDIGPRCRLAPAAFPRVLS